MINSLSWSLSLYTDLKEVDDDKLFLKVGKTPDEKIEPDKLDGDVDTTEAL